MNKSEIRKLIKQRKNNLSDEARRLAAKRVFDYVESTDVFANAEHVLVYHSLPDELSTLGFIDEWHSRKRLYLPRVNGDDLEILPYDAELLNKGAFNIAEPQGGNVVDVAKMDLIIVPGVAFDSKGNRIGRGKGFYDRLLSRADAMTIGVCYQCQIYDEMTTDSFDIPLDYVISESGIIKMPH